MGREYAGIRKTITHSGGLQGEAELDAFTREMEGYAKLGVDTVIMGPRVDEPAVWIERSAAAAVSRLADLG